MALIRFRDNTYGRPCVVSAEDLLSAIQRDKRVVALRHPNGVKFGDDGYSQRRGDSTCILLSYIPLSVRDEAKTVLERESLFQKWRKRADELSYGKEKPTGGKYEREFVGDAFPILFAIARFHPSLKKQIVAHAKLLNEGLSAPHSALSMAARKGGRP
jgi:hypothetical protein